MADVETVRARYPLTDTTNRIYTSTNHSQTKQWKPQNSVNPVRASTEPPPNRFQSESQRDIPIAAADAAPQSGVPLPADGKRVEDVDESKRLSQASYASTSSSRSRHKTHVGPWQLGKTLGKGSSARVQLCRHSVTNQLAAVKIVNRKMAYLVQDSSLAALSRWDSSLPEKAEGEMRVPMAIEREVAILKLIEHPHIMRLYDIWENRSEIYLILEFIDQGDLFTFINSRGRLTEVASMYFFRQMISAIGYCHSFNICHRDLKPENILITADFKIKIADFGMAALHQTAGHRLVTACGSPHYAAPELLKNRQYRGDKADIWSLGVILYAMLSATLPFDDPDLRVMMAKTKKGQYEMPKGISLEAEDLIYRMLQVNPDRRISLKDIWHHPLVQKYGYVDDLSDEHGQLPDTRKGFQFTPIARSEIDPQLLRQLRSMWHMFSDQDLESKLACQEPNDQKAFYWLLLNYREKQLEDFKPELAHSMSDYHHLKPGAWKKRMSTCEFSSANANGHGRSISRFTVISNAAETDAGTIASYDPYRNSRDFPRTNSRVSHAKITIHREEQRASLVVSQAARMRSVSDTRRGRAGSVRGSIRGPGSTRAASSRGSLASVTSDRNSMTHPRTRPNLRHKRGVDFSHIRKQASSSPYSANRARDAEQANADNTETSLPGHSKNSPSSDVISGPPTKRPKALGAPKIPPNASVIFGEELRKFSYTIAKDCDDAFKMSVVEENSVAGSPIHGDENWREASPLSLTFSGSGQVSPLDASTKPWDTRPLPPLPSNRTLDTPSQVEASRDGRKDSRSAKVINEKATDLPLRSLDTDGPDVSLTLDRRVVSAPAASQRQQALSPLPAIHEHLVVGLVPQDKARIVSAPPHTPPRKAANERNSGLEYLSKVENTIRVVQSPTPKSPVKAPEPLNIRKQSLMSRTAEIGSESASSRKTSIVDGDDHVYDNAVPKRKLSSSWFRKSSKAETELEMTKPGRGDERKFSTATTQVDDRGGDRPVNIGKPKSFKFPFWKHEKSKDARMSIADETKGEDKHVGKELQPAKDSASSRRHSKASDERHIEVKQSWLARLFRVKPATTHLCMVLSRKRARQEVAILLREWRRYGIRGVQVDKERNIVFARVAAQNYLRIKEVEFAAEVMAVIEHGTKQPLSIVRFTQQRGAASSFTRVVETMRLVFESRHLLVEDKNKQKMMIKTLNTNPA